MLKDPAADRSIEVAELRRQIGAIDADITLVNERLNESQGMFSAFLIIFVGKTERSIVLMLYASTADGVVVVEALRAELALAKEQARASDAAALKAAKELRA